MLPAIQVKDPKIFSFPLYQRYISYFLLTHLIIYPLPKSHMKSKAENTYKIMLLNHIVIIDSISENMFVKYPNILGKWNIWWPELVGKKKDKYGNGGRVGWTPAVASSPLLPKPNPSCIHIASTFKQNELAPLPPARLGMYNYEPTDSNCTSFSSLGKALKQKVIEFSAVCEAGANFPAFGISSGELPLSPSSLLACPIRQVNCRRAPSSWKWS